MCSFNIYHLAIGKALMSSICLGKNLLGPGTVSCLQEKNKKRFLTICYAATPQGNNSRPEVVKDLGVNTAFSGSLILFINKIVIFVHSSCRIVSGKMS